MENISFNKEGNVWVAEFDIHSATALKVVRRDVGAIRIYVSSFGNDYGIDYNATHSEVFERELVYNVYPKKVRVVSTSGVRYAVINSSNTPTGGDVSVLSERLDKLEGTNDTTDDIDTMQEVKEFLSGMKRGDTIQDAIMDGEEMKKAANEVFGTSKQ